MPEYAGYVAWRGLVEEDRLSPATRALLMQHFIVCLPARRGMSSATRWPVRTAP